VDEQDIAADMARARAYLHTLPALAESHDIAARATVDHDLVFRVAGPDGLPDGLRTGIGPTSLVPSPGWFFRAALAACAAMFITMRAAEKGVAIGGLSVTVDAESDDRGALGMSADIPAGPLEMRVTVQYSSSNRDEEYTRDVLQWGVEHCPVYDAVVRPVPISFSIERVAPVGEAESLPQPG
jgi:uncharacterized OsmC-like protein